MVLVVAPLTGPKQTLRDFYAPLRDELPLRESECNAFIAAQGSAPLNLADMTGLEHGELGYLAVHEPHQNATVVVFEHLCLWFFYDPIGRPVGV